MLVSDNVWQRSPGIPFHWELDGFCVLVISGASDLTFEVEDIRTSVTKLLHLSALVFWSKSRDRPPEPLLRCPQLFV
jgi:hypothetical protein